MWERKGRSEEKAAITSEGLQPEKASSQDSEQRGAEKGEDDQNPPRLCVYPPPRPDAPKTSESKGHCFTAF